LPQLLRPHHLTPDTLPRLTWSDDYFPSEQQSLHTAHILQSNANAG